MAVTKAALWRGRRQHDLLVGPRQDANQWRRDRQGTAPKGQRRKARMRLPRAHGPDLQPPNLHGLGLPVVDLLYRLHARPPLHHSQRVLSEFIPILGTGMMLWGFIFLSRKWANDKLRLQYRLRKLSTPQGDAPAGSRSLDPMWLLIFPEGTNLSNNGRKASKKWADKNNIEDLKHALLPRSTGLNFCLHELKGTMDYVYDCTLAYEGVP